MKNRYAHIEYTLGQIYFPDWAVLVSLKQRDCAYKQGSQLKMLIQSQCFQYGKY